MYVRRKRQEGVHGNNLEIQAISELFNRPIEVFSPENGPTPLNIFHAEYKTEDAPIRLSYHDGNHYNAVIDPLVPTAGLGLGLPGLQPGLADKLQMAKAVAESDATADEMELARALKESDDDELQRALKESQLSTEHVSTVVFIGYIDSHGWILTVMCIHSVECFLFWFVLFVYQSRSNAAMAQSDADATYFELEQAALENSLKIYMQQEHGQKKRASSPKQEKHERRQSQLESKSRGSSTTAKSLPPLTTSVSFSEVP